jgi:hypothetical protein
MKPITKVLERLSKVKQRKPDQWMACCPAHDDRDPSLSIKEAHDGKVLLHCWSGCTADDIVAAIGLELSDLFEESDYTPNDPGQAARLSPLRFAFWRMHCAYWHEGSDCPKGRLHESPRPACDWG